MGNCSPVTGHSGYLGYTPEGLIVLPDTQSRLDALPQLRASPQETVVGKWVRGEWPVSPACKLPDSIQSNAAEQALLRTWGHCQDRVWLVQRSHHLHKEQRFGQRDVGEERENHDWDKGHTH